jgi:hypothetical protein
VNISGPSISKLSLNWSAARRRGPLVFRYRHYLAHIVVQKRLFATVVPPNGHTRPISFRDRASIHFVIAPANAVADFKVSRLIAGHLSPAYSQLAPMPGQAASKFHAASTPPEA